MVIDSLTNSITNKCIVLYYLYLVLLSDIPAAPEGPIQVSAITKDSALLTWKPPKDDGGCDVNAYIIERRDAKRTTWTKLATVDGVTLDYRATNLIEGNQYHFRVIAENDVGQSEPLETSATVVPKSQYGRSISPFAWIYLPYDSPMIPRIMTVLIIFMLCI